MDDRASRDEIVRSAERDEIAASARAFRRGSPDGIRAVQQRVRRIISYRGFRMRPQDRQDLEQEVMTQLWQATNRTDFVAGHRFWGFVEVVTARRCIDWLRGRGTQHREVTLGEHLPHTSAGPLESTLAQERHELAQAALAELAKPCRDLLHLHFAQRKSYRELSELLGKSEGALRVQVHRCIARTREIVRHIASEPTSKARAEER